MSTKCWFLILRFDNNKIDFNRQLRFLRLLKDFMFEWEKIEKRDLIQSPFTIIHPQGIRGVFRPVEIDEILQLTEKPAA